MPHFLETEILNAALSTPINTNVITANLTRMAQEEVYLTIRSDAGNSIYDVLLKRTGSILFKNLVHDKHNIGIDKIKRKRLAVFLKHIHSQDLQGLQEENEQLKSIYQTNPPDLTFLLTEAIRLKSPLSLLEWLISAGADCNGLGTSGRRPVHIAIETGNTDVLQLLHEKGANLALEDVKHRNLLHNALYHNQDFLLKLLIEVYHYNPNAWDYNGNGLLHAATLAAQQDKVALLLQLGINPNLKNIHGETPLDIATGGTRGSDILDFPWLAEYPPNQPNKQAIRSARALIANDLRFAMASQARIERILKAIHTIEDGALHLSSHDMTNNDIPTLITELEQTPFIHTINLSQNALTQAGIDKLVAYLQEKTWVVHLILTGCRVTPQKITEYTQLLHPDERLKKLLSFYDEAEPLTVVAMLLDTRANFSEIAEEEWYLWHYASFYGHTKVIKSLLAHQIAIENDINDGYENKNCMHLAAERKHSKMLKILLESGMFFVDKKHGLGKTALMISLEAQSMECIKVLLLHGADQDDIFKHDCLLDLALDQCPQAVSLLMQHGAKTNNKSQKYFILY